MDRDIVEQIVSLPAPQTELAVRERFFRNELDRSAVDRIVPVEVLASWERIRQRIGLTERLPPPSPGPSLSRDEPLLSGARVLASLQKLLGSLERITPGAIVMLCNRDGRIIASEEANALGARLANLGLRRGVSLLEHSAGTNAVDLSLRLRTAFATAGRHHTCSVLQDFWMSAAPIVLETGDLRGVVVLIGEGDDVPPPVVELAAFAERLLESHILAADLNERLSQLLDEQKAIVNNISDGLIVLNRDAVVTHMNAHAGRILNVNPETSTGQRFADLLDFEPIIEPIFKTGKGYRDEELVIKTSRRHLHLIDTAVPIKDAAGTVISIVNTFREFGDVRRVAQRIGGNAAFYKFDNIIGEAPAFKSAIESARKTASGQASILLLGESGVGKELFAQATHLESERRNGPFIAINCGALPRDLIESELFGYVGGSFTGANKTGRPGKFELAAGGTIFLDEISEMPLDVQVKLLRVLQEREVVRVGGDQSIPVDFRIVSASNRDLRKMVKDGSFRQDLFYRINVIEIIIPPLRERRDDIPTLAYFYLRNYAKQLNKSAYEIAPKTLQQLVDYDWPGNVRELQNAIERLVNLSDGEVVSGAIHGGASFPGGSPSPAAALDETGLMSFEEHEKRIIGGTLEALNYNITRAADILRLSKPTLYRKVKEYGIELDRKSTS